MLQSTGRSSYCTGVPHPCERSPGWQTAGEGEQAKRAHEDVCGERHHPASSALTRDATGFLLCSSAAKCTWQLCHLSFPFSRQTGGTPTSHLCKPAMPGSMQCLWAHDRGPRMPREKRSGFGRGALDRATQQDKATNRRVSQHLAPRMVASKLQLLKHAHL